MISPKARFVYTRPHKAVFELSRDPKAIHGDLKIEREFTVNMESTYAKAKSFIPEIAIEGFTVVGMTICYPVGNTTQESYYCFTNTVAYYGLTPPQPKAHYEDQEISRDNSLTSERWIRGLNLASTA